MKKYLWLFIIIFMSSCNGNKKQVVFLGDSITEEGRTLELGFINLLEESLDSEKFNLIGKGISGDKVSDLLVRYEDDVLVQNPDIVFIYIGINDVWHSYDVGKGSDIDFYEKGLRKIITDIKKRGAKIILCTPTVIGERVTFEDELEVKRDQELDAFAGVVRNLSSEFNTELLDLRTIFKDYIVENNQNNDYQDFLTDDGVHLNDAGNKLIADEMIKYIN
ncbi:MAG: SGNH/GDSL hydrolase family protein [Pelagibacterales bacterium]|jgi:lysophospholipase L1-like esterase|nr:SGNH/GDSL hydrolase family protein [Pelagibacterales bacterium]